MTLLKDERIVDDGDGVRAYAQRARWLGWGTQRSIFTLEGARGQRGYGSALYFAELHNDLTVSAETLHCVYRRAPFNTRVLVRALIGGTVARSGVEGTLRLGGLSSRKHEGNHHTLNSSGRDLFTCCLFVL